jgi:hypothetical protein
MGTRRIAMLLVLAAFVAGIALDRLWLAAQAPLFSHAILVRPGVVWSGAKLHEGFAFGLLTPLALSLVVLAIALFPWTHAAYPVARKERFRLIARVAGLILLIPLWIVSAGMVYGLLRPYLPASVASPLEAFGFRPGLYYGVADAAHQLIAPIDGSVACLLALLVGIAIVYYKIPR